MVAELKILFYSSLVFAPFAAGGGDWGKDNKIFAIKNPLHYTAGFSFV